MRTRATRDGEHYVLNGTKTFVTNATVADLVVAYATIDPRLGVTGVTAFIIERGTPGMSITRPLDKMGLRTSPMAEIVFEDCRVPVGNRLGREGRGALVFDSSMEWERGCILATCLGVMRRQLEACIRHAQSRKQFGRAIGKFQSVANRIVDMRGPARYVPAAGLPDRLAEGSEPLGGAGSGDREAARVGGVRPVVA